VAINKSNSPAWVKVTLIVLIVAFVMSFIVIAANPFGSPQAQTGAPATGTTSAADAQYQSQVAALTSQIQADPQNYQALVNLGNAYFDWAIAKQQESQASTATAGADLPLWVAAKDAYSRAIAIKGDESPVRVDYAISAYYSGDNVTAVRVADEVMKDDPEFAPAFFNGGIFLAAAGENARAIVAFERYLVLDPDGKSGDPNLAKQNITQLKEAAATPAPSTATTP